MESFNSIESISYLNLFRDEGYPTYYPNSLWFLAIDYVTLRVVTLFLSLWVIFMIICPGYSGRERWFFICRATVSVAIPLFIVVCYYAPNWESDSVRALVQTRFIRPTDVVAKIGLNIGIRGFNITLREEASNRYNNEQFWWNWAAGDSFRFLEETGYLKHQYRSAANRGLPIPYLWILDYFTVDGEEYRFGRYYQQAGWYCSAFLQFSLGLWLLASCLFLIVIEYGSLMMINTGLSLITVNMIWSFHSNSVFLEIPFQSVTGRQSVSLLPGYSWAFWINLINGIFCIIAGLTIYIVDLKFPDLTAQFFGIDIIQNYEQYFQEIDEEKRRLQGKSLETTDLPTHGRPNSRILDANDPKYMVLRKKVSSNRLSRFHHNTIREAADSTLRTFKKSFNTRKPPLLTPTEKETSEPHYAIPKIVTIPVQPESDSKR